MPTFKKRTVLLVTMLLVVSGASAVLTYAQSSSSRESRWPPITSYADMRAPELGVEIGFMRNDLEYFRQRDDPKSKSLATQARNRLNLLFQLYSERTGRSLESVLEMYGYPTGRP